MEVRCLSPLGIGLAVSAITAQQHLQLQPNVSQSHQYYSQRLKSVGDAINIVNAGPFHIIPKVQAPPRTTKFYNTYN